VPWDSNREAFMSYFLGRGNVEKGGRGMSHRSEFPFELQVRHQNHGTAEGEAVNTFAVQMRVELVERRVWKLAEDDER
jgi:hypothetical protein